MLNLGIESLTNSDICAVDTVVDIMCGVIELQRDEILLNDQMARLEVLGTSLESLVAITHEVDARGVTPTLEALVGSEISSVVGFDIGSASPEVALEGLVSLVRKGWEKFKAMIAKLWKRIVDLFKKSSKHDSKTSVTIDDLAVEIEKNADKVDAGINKGKGIKVTRAREMVLMAEGFANTDLFSGDLDKESVKLSFANMAKGPALNLNDMVREAMTELDKLTEPMGIGISDTGVASILVYLKGGLSWSCKEHTDPGAAGYDAATYIQIAKAAREWVKREEMFGKLCDKLDFGKIGDEVLAENGDFDNGAISNVKAAVQLQLRWKQLILSVFSAGRPKLTEIVTLGQALLKNAGL